MFKISLAFSPRGVFIIGVISISQPKVQLKNHSVRIQAVYPNVFRVEEMENGSLSCHTVQYVEVLTKQVEIVELMQQA